MVEMRMRNQPERPYNTQAKQGKSRERESKTITFKLLCRYDTDHTTGARFLTLPEFPTDRPLGEPLREAGGGTVSGMIIVFGSKKTLFLIPAFLPETAIINQAPQNSRRSLVITRSPYYLEQAVSSSPSPKYCQTIPDTVVFIRYFDLVWPRRVRYLLFLENLTGQEATERLSKQHMSGNKRNYQFLC